MSTLEKYYKKLDESEYDCRDEHTINSEFQEVIQELIEAGDQETADLANVDREVFALRKSFDKDPDTNDIKGITCQMSGTQTLEDGTEIQIYWPDISKYTEKEFAFIAKRYNETENLFAKTEYGLVLYFKSPFPEHKHNDFKTALCNELFELARIYFNKAKKDVEKNYYGMDFSRTIKSAFYIASKNKLEKLRNIIIKYLYKNFIDWDITIKGSQRFVLDIIYLFTENYKEVKSLIDVNNIYKKCQKAAREIEKRYLWGCIHIADSCLKLENKTTVKSDFNWLQYKAKLYEKLANEAIERDNLNVVSSFIDNALHIYENLKDEKNIQRLQKKYSEQRGNMNLGQIKHEPLKEEVERIQQQIKKTIEENNSSGILDTIVTAPMFGRLENIHCAVKEGNKVAILSSIIPLTILDKFGNKVAQYYPEELEDGYDSNFWQTYSYFFQLGTQILTDFFKQSYHTNKISYGSIEKYLEDTWYNKPIKRDFNGRLDSVFPINIILPPIRLFFEEMGKWKADNTYQLNILPIVDSLTLKIEAILRYMCEKIGIATFKRVRNSDIVMEKTLDEILGNLKHIHEGKKLQTTNFSEEHRIFIKYYLSEKIGINLRNEVAHGLLDIDEYSISQPIVLLSIILRLSKYTFNTN